MPTDRRFKRSERVVSSGDFVKAKRRGRRIRGKLITLSYVAGGLKRIGIVASRKSGNAVERNRIKRTIREFFRNNKGAFPDGDCIFILSEGLGATANEDIVDEMEKLLRSLG
jgi:ribonuclease P protein component